MTTIHLFSLDHDQSLPWRLRDAVKDLGSESLVSAGVPAVAMSWKDGLDKAYVPWKVDKVIGSDPSGSFDSVTEVDSKRHRVDPSSRVFDEAGPILIFLPRNESFHA